MFYCTEKAGTFFQYEIGFFSFPFPPLDLAMLDLGPMTIKGEQMVEVESHYHSKAMCLNSSSLLLNTGQANSKSSHVCSCLLTYSP